MIPFLGLKQGFHDFEYEIDDAFFGETEYSIIHSGNVHVTLNLEKKETMLIGKFIISGTVSTDCDRCNDPLEVPVKGEYQLIFRFGTDPSDDESLIIMHPDTYEIDVRENIYELITVSMPSRLSHKREDCNEEMIALLRQYSGLPDQNDEDLDDEDWDDEDDWDDDEDWDDDDDNEDDPIDPRWSVLKDLN